MSDPFRGRPPRVPIDRLAAQQIPGQRGAGLHDYGGSAPPAAPDFWTGGRSLTVFPPDFFPPPGAQEFYSSVDFSSPGAGTTTPAGLVTQLPPGSSGIIRVVGYGVINMTTATNLTWEILLNGAVVPGWARRIFARNLPAVNVSEDAYIRVPDGAQISLALVNTDGAAYTVNGSYSGWRFSTADALRWTGGQI